MNPRTTPTVSAAKYEIEMYHAEIAACVALKKTLEEKLSATFAVLSQQHPDLVPDLETLIGLAQDVGHEEGQREDLDIMLGQFRNALPYNIRLAMGLVAPAPKSMN